PELDQRRFLFAVRAKDLRPVYDCPGREQSLRQLDYGFTGILPTVGEPVSQRAMNFGPAALIVLALALVTRRRELRRPLLIASASFSCCSLALCFFLST